MQGCPRFKSGKFSRIELAKIKMKVYINLNYLVDFHKVDCEQVLTFSTILQGRFPFFPMPIFSQAAAIRFSFTTIFTRTNMIDRQGSQFNPESAFTLSVKSKRCTMRFTCLY
ncbi:hypothetical protein NQ317_018202 [Molorchus minor]|uniref:Uncharacterized protein n=1 Tax=Molorchus minor TaxID=1323400 RepID=A0ABQ9JGG6_9CUCU|nr:hypothetical protein NQ317_018202 [Molorchus minor]